MSKRYGRVIGLKPEYEEEYIRYHAAVWPEVLKTIRDCNIRNYSIFLSNHRLFAYFEYTGSDYEADMTRMAADPKTQEWWTIMEPMQAPDTDREAGSWWTEMPEVFHTD
jgi:L-rhamnose mutarotase